MQTLIFWQNIVSPHQLPYIEAIPKVCPGFNVILVVEQGMTKSRKAMGWVTEDVTETSRFNVIAAPSDEAIHALFISYPEAQHFFSGIRSNHLVYKGFKVSLAHEVKRHLIVEGPTYYKKPKPLHVIKTLITEKHFFKKIDKVFTIGKEAQSWYKLWGFSSQNIIPFSYCVEKTDFKISPFLENKPTLKLLFVGSLIKLKGLLELLDVLEDIPVKIHFDIIGEGLIYSVLKEKVAKSNSLHEIRFLGGKSNNATRKLMCEYDSLILPSLYDGWGAVINEALMAGLFVLCSTNCGAQELIQDKFNGIVFSHKKDNDLYAALHYCATHVATIRAKKEDILQWSSCIEGKVIADYFVKALSSNTLVTPPWRNFK